MNKEQIQHRIAEIEAAITQQGNLLQQMNNQLLMFHGAKEEYLLQIKIIDEQERLDKEKLETSNEAETPKIEELSE